MKYWFKRRRYGYGWIPVTAQGWCLLIGYVIALMLSSKALEAYVDPASSNFVVIYSLFLLLLTGAFLTIVVSTSPKPKWRWGKKPGDNPDEDW